jgi:hypothetical protein
VVPPFSTDSSAAGAGRLAAPNWVVDDSGDPVVLEFAGDLCAQLEEGVERVDILVGCAGAL